MTVTGCLLLLAMAIALPFALKWPRQTRWLKDTPVGQACALFLMACLSRGTDHDAAHVPPSWKEWDQDHGQSCKSHRVPHA